MIEGKKEERWEEGGWKEKRKEASKESRWGNVVSDLMSITRLRDLSLSLFSGSACADSPAVCSNHVHIEPTRKPVSFQLSSSRETVNRSQGYILIWYPVSEFYLSEVRVPY